MLLDDELSDITEEQAQAIHGFVKVEEHLYESAIRSDEWLDAVSEFDDALLALLRLHRNWNEDTGERSALTCITCYLCNTC